MWPEEYNKIRKELDENPDSLPLWTSLIDLVEDSFSKQEFSIDLKVSLYSNFNEFLSKWPLLFGYWKKLTSLTYQLDGLEASLLVLKRSLEVFPNCLELWIDYLVILIGQTDNKLMLQDQLIDEEFIRNEFEKAVKLVGNVFMGHEVWDKYISWEQSIIKQNNQDNEKIVRILFKSIQVPLYQYSKMYQDFDKEWESLSIDQLNSITNFNLQTKPEFKVKFNLIFNNTQQYVSEIWNFESLIKQKFFNNEINEEDLKTWENYLNFQISKYNSNNSVKNQVISTFEQCLIPMCKLDKIWYKYLSFLNFIAKEDTKFINSVYFKCCNYYLSLNNFEIRLNWALFIESNYDDEFDRINEIYLSIIKNNSLKFKPISTYIKFLVRNKVKISLENIIDCYLSNDDSILDINEKRLLNLINDKTLSILVTELFKLNEEKLRLYGKYFKLEHLNYSVSFHLQIYNYFKQQRDLDELKLIVHKILNSNISIIFKNLIIKDYNEFLEFNQEKNDNLNQYYMLKLDLPFNLVSPDRLIDQSTNKNLIYPGFQKIDSPTITNMNIDEIANINKIIELPTFKNVEKATKKVSPIDNE